MTKTRVLIVDDHQVVRKGVASILACRPEWEICGEAANGREALEAVDQLRPDVVIMDISMPEMNGLEASRRIVKGYPNIKVLILSMHESELLLREAFACGIRAYVLKSDVDTELLAALDALQRGKMFSTAKVTDSILRAYGVGGPTPEPANSKNGQLSPREREIVQLVAEGKSSKEVAAALHISVKTVETHRAHIMDKLGVEGLSALVRYAIRNHIIEC